MQTTIIEKLSHDGRGIARINGKTTFIRGAITDETVEYKIFNRKRDYDEGYVTSVISPSIHRVSPKCPHFGVCGGCSLQHIKESTQIDIKQNLLLDILGRIGHCQPDEILPPLSASHWHYRNKARLGVNYNQKQGEVFLGFRKKTNPRQILSVPECKVLNHKLVEQLANLQNLIASLSEPQSIPQIEVACGDEDVALIFRHLSPLSQQDEAKLVDFAKLSQFRIYLQPKGIDNFHLFYS